MDNIMTFVAENIKDDEMFNIGCTSGWIFIGTKKEWDMYVNVINEDYANLYKDREEAAEKDCSIFRITNCKRIDTRKFKNGIRETDDEWRKRVHKLADALHETIDIKFNALTRAKERNKNFIPFNKRNVKEFYISEISGTSCIIIEGDDLGLFWSKKEFNKFYKNGKSVKKLCFKTSEDNAFGEKEEED